MDSFNPKDLSRFADFTIHTTPYKTVSSHHSITVDILIPNHLTTTPTPSPSTPPPSSPRPILLRFHGGGLVAGSSLFPDFFAPWHLQLAQRHSAIIVTPNYRLLPEASVADVLADFDDLWRWMHADLPGYVEQVTGGAVRVDTGRVMTAGDSAGGWLSLMVGLRYAEGIRAVTAAYPMVDVRSGHFVEAYEKRTFGLEQQPANVVEGHVARVREEREEGREVVVSADAEGERVLLMFAYLQHGWYRESFPRERREWAVLERLEDGARFPRGGVFVWHGRGDSVVPVEGSRKLEEMVRECDPELRFRLHVGEGEHGFDSKTSIDEGGVDGGWIEGRCGCVAGVKT